MNFEKEKVFKTKRTTRRFKLNRNCEHTQPSQAACTKKKKEKQALCAKSVWNL